MFAFDFDFALNLRQSASLIFWIVTLRFPLDRRTGASNFRIFKSTDSGAGHSKMQTITYGGLSQKPKEELLCLKDAQVLANAHSDFPGITRKS